LPIWKDRLEKLAGAPLILHFLLASASVQDGNAVSYHDLTAHEWAGLPVTIQLWAKDGAGQDGQSDTLKMILPARHFQNQTAQALVSARRILFLAPDQKQAIAELLLGINTQPDLFHGDKTLYLGLRMAARRLQLDRGLEDGTLRSVRDLLWELALRLEDGEVSLMARELRDLQQDLMNALNNDAPEEEIERLMDELQAAMDRFLQALTEQALQNGLDPTAPTMPLNPDQMVDRAQLQDMMDKIRDLSRSGAKEAARQMLSQMQQLLENLQAPQMAGPQQQGSGQQADQNGQQGLSRSEAMQMLQTLDQIRQNQQKMTDETYQNLQQRQPGQRQSQSAPQNWNDQALPLNPPTLFGQDRMEALQNQMQQLQQMMRPGRDQNTPPSLEDMLRNLPSMDDLGRGAPRERQQTQEQRDKIAEGQKAETAARGQRQEALRRDLGELMRRFGDAGGEIPTELGQAERAMREAGQALEQNTLTEALPAQKQATEALEQGLQSLVEQIMNQMAQQQPGSGQNNGSGQGSPLPTSQDPLGRRQDQGQNASQYDGDVQLPEESDLQRAREILQELRRRSGQKTRSLIEQEYLKRLLERF